MLLRTESAKEDTLSAFLADMGFEDIIDAELDEDTKKNVQQDIQQQQKQIMQQQNFTETLDKGLKDKIKKLRAQPDEAAIKTIKDKKYPKQLPTLADIIDSPTAQQQLTELLPPGSRMYKDSYHKMWTAYVDSGPSKSRSWGTHGFEGAAMKCISEVWKAWLIKHPTATCPMKGIEGIKGS